MSPTGGAALRPAPGNGNAAPGANRDGAILRNEQKPLGSASTLNKYEQQPASSTGKTPGTEKDVHRLVRIWLTQLRQLKDKRYGDGPIPEDDGSRRFAAITLELLVQRPDGRREALDFLILLMPVDGAGGSPRRRRQRDPAEQVLDAGDIGQRARPDMGRTRRLLPSHPTGRRHRRRNGGCPNDEEHRWPARDTEAGAVAPEEGTAPGHSREGHCRRLAARPATHGRGLMHSGEKANSLPQAAQ